jgi:uncharacterized membrane protein
VGQIVGTYSDSNGLHGFLDDHGVFTTIDVPFPGARNTQLSAINSQGQIVGSYMDASFNVHGFLLSGGIFTTIDVPGSDYTAANGMNNKGQIVGFFQVFFQGGHGFLATPIQVITVTIDIKPGEDPPSINPRSQGKIPVAILTTDTLDATTVNAATVRFGAMGTEAAPVLVAVEDVNSGGRPDLLLHFNTQDTGILCGQTFASLTGETFSGQAIQGSDSIVTVGCQ